MPGVRGPAQTPTTPLEAVEPFKPSSSKWSSSRSPTDIVNTRTSWWISRRVKPAIRAASRTSAARSAGCLEPTAGGSRSIVGRTNAAARISRSSNPGYASASFRDCLAIEPAVRSVSLKKKIGPLSVSET